MKEKIKNLSVLAFSRFILAFRCVFCYNVAQIILVCPNGKSRRVWGRTLLGAQIDVSNTSASQILAIKAMTFGFQGLHRDEIDTDAPYLLIVND